MKQKSVAAVTLGCKVNYAESSSIIDMLVSAGWQLNAIDDGADVIIIHTCAVTGEAERKSRQQIRKIIRNHPGCKVGVIGCYAQLDPERIAAIEGVSFVLGTSDKFATEWYGYEPLPNDPVPLVKVSPSDQAKIAHPACSILSRPETGRTRAFLKIQDGCSFGCAYCSIPLARGRSRSVTLPEVLDRARKIADAGYREIVLTGINIGDYRDGDTRLAALLRRLEAIDVSRIRVSSVEPQLLDDELIDIVAASTKIMPHFHLPLQSGSDTVLRAMGRHYDTAFYRERLMKAVSSIKGCAIGADVMVGYPGESDRDFEEMCRFIDELPVAYLHVFKCSPRPRTRLFAEIAEKKLIRVPSAEASSRAARLGEIGETIERRFAGAFIGSRLKILFEESEALSGGAMRWSGYSENYLRVSVEVGAEFSAGELRGQVREVLVDGFGEGWQLQGRLLS
ncbi:tRNA (N(6)-L-threonylcarbamoyladenosine(37)-C(2))-methylthiotransferase MtaB [Chlorobaculum thiosulfatiphilum]|uniref:tRNA (N(6)-L-threonylcarbamoyladenosine(37)-C(2))-methylthiotransferase MtaB n=1 Tax=Chlorobaculum thiosulfatiphilum TaxID=115852 RepID=A0A5C4S477_CHLTI|nr:tRNA (N(6)-L-threonylcarbamoyladenosine(37)-C(2))-methylthiotransferase MtaB [Chlorobaculum thiosulfatiphilum]TNJ38303.1 tRNA (N(6)-L-threonylcarbamoyladenosine(37)-C(2))-methylthiotransferase MtaB [Chlorobaculum thiosulfatiphilum]